MKLAEGLACTLATDVLCVSDSARCEAVSARVCSGAKARVLGAGSSHGVDLEIFDPVRFDPSERRRIRGRYGIPPTALVAGFVGRFVTDKGFADLMSGWQMMLRKYPDSHLVLCGDREQHDPVAPATWELVVNDSRVHIVKEAIENMPQVYAAMDVCVLPTYREGLPNAILESAAMGIPVVATRVTGCVDAVRDGETGFLIPPRNPAAVAEAVGRLFDNPDLRVRMGQAGRRFVARFFSHHDVSLRLAREYRELAQKLTAPSALRWSDLAKRGCDICFASAALVFVAPVLIATMAASRLMLGPPTLFHQKRIGYREREFTLLKLRTMADARDATGDLLPDHLRMTSLGRLLRKLSLDELPQLCNVLKGEMSMVGPRPLLPEYLPRYTPFQRRRHEVKPGITGWAQVNGRNGLTWEQKFELDVWYVDHWSLWLDVKILWLTVLKVVCGEGISQRGHATMPEFMGPEPEPRAK
jgi:lipopolysaccharide/colanic/teichoic acid biosynthesis glycosyltransferase